MENLNPALLSQLMEQSPELRSAVKSELQKKLSEVKEQQKELESWLNHPVFRSKLNQENAISVAEGTVASQVMKYLRENPASTATQLIEYLGKAENPNFVYVTLNRLTKAEKVIRHGTAGKYTYSLV